MMTMPVFVTRSRTTKWFMSQCRIAGSASWASDSTLDLDAARGEADALGQIAQLEQRLAAAARHRELADLGQARLAVEVGADRGEAGEAALVELARRDERHLAPAEEAEVRASAARFVAPRARRGRRCR